MAVAVAVAVAVAALMAVLMPILPLMLALCASHSAPFQAWAESEIGTQPSDWGTQRSACEGVLPEMVSEMNEEEEEAFKEKVRSVLGQVEKEVAAAKAKAVK
eukprot:375081-Pleurochrysis_carterae.AAC.1